MSKEFPSTKEMAEKAAEKWTETTLDEIFEEIEVKSRQGERYAYFFRTRLSKEAKKELKILKYQIQTFWIDRAPGFKISW